MKKLWNSILCVLFMAACLAICFSHFAHRLFQEDLGSIVIQEVDINGKIDMLFQNLERYVPYESEKLENLKEGIKSNDRMQSFINEAGRHMLNDIVNGDGENQDINAVIKEIIYSYSEPFTKNMETTGFDTYIDTLLQNMSTQRAYDDAVQFIQQEIPQPYQKIMKICSVFSNPMALIISAGMAIVILVILVVFNWKYLAWSFTVGLAGVLSGTLLLLIAQIMPKIFERMIMGLGHRISQLDTINFNMITIYGIGFFTTGVLCLILYYAYAKKSLMNK